MHAEHLRPLERRLLRLSEAGVDEDELGRRFVRSPEHIQRVLELARMPGRAGPRPRGDILTPMERRVLRWREQGAELDEVADRFGRGPDHVAQVERMAHYKLAG
jgi:DNA-binding CsgD family transcriptional regulator